MNQLLNSWLTTLNGIGGAFWSYAAGMFVQFGVLILLLLAIDFLLRKRVRATIKTTGRAGGMRKAPKRGH